MKTWNILKKEPDVGLEQPSPSDKEEIIPNNNQLNKFLTFSFQKQDGSMTSDNPLLHLLRGQKTQSE